MASGGSGVPTLPGTLSCSSPPVWHSDPVRGIFMGFICEGRAISFTILSDIRVPLMNGVGALWDLKMERMYANLTERATENERKKGKKTWEGRVFLFLNEHVRHNTTHGWQECPKCAASLSRVCWSRSIPSVSGVQRRAEIHPSKHAHARARVVEERGMTQATSAPPPRVIYSEGEVKWTGRDTDDEWTRNDETEQLLDLARILLFTFLSPWF